GLPTWGRGGTAGAAGPGPGPTTRAGRRWSAASPASSQPAAGTFTPTASVGRPGSGWRPGDATRTMPAPDRWAARAARWAAPVIPGDPATTSSAARHLWLGPGRAGSPAATSE